MKKPIIDASIAWILSPILDNHHSCGEYLRHDLDMVQMNGNWCSEHVLAGGKGTSDLGVKGPIKYNINMKVMGTISGKQVFIGFGCTLPLKSDCPSPTKKRTKQGAGSQQNKGKREKARDTDAAYWLHMSTSESPV